MRKVAGASSLLNSDRWQREQEKAADIYEAASRDVRERLHHLDPRRFAPKDRSGLSVAPTRSNQAFDEPLPIFLDSGRDGKLEEEVAAIATEPGFQHYEFPDHRDVETAYASMRMPEPEVIEPPPVLYERSPLSAFLSRMAALGLVLGAAGVLFYFRNDLAAMLPMLGSKPQIATTSTPEQRTPAGVGSPFDGKTPALPDGAPPLPSAQLVASQAQARAAGEAFPLGAKVYGGSNDYFVVVTGLAPGASLSQGQMTGDNVWTLTASELDRAAIVPPKGFAGSMDLAIELRKVDNSLSDRRSLHFHWLEAAVADAVASPEAIHHLSPASIASLQQRADALISSGDVAAARLVLQRAAEAGDGHAAVTLAGTYDPASLARLGVHGVVPDVQMARFWYQRASQFGASDAVPRLRALAGKH